VGVCTVALTLAFAHQRLTLRWLVSFCTDYMNPEAFSENLVKCMQNDWQLGADSLLAFFPAAIKLAGKVSGVDMTIELLKAELQKKPQTALRTITDAYLKLVKDAKKKRKEGDPWPLIIIDEANRLTKWKDTESLEQLLAFFVYLTKQEQLAHVILATSDTFLMQWLESGAPRLAVAGLSCFRYLSCGRRSHQRPVPRHSRGEQLDPRGGAHLLLRLHRAVPQTSAWRERSMGARVRIMRRQPRAAAELRFEGGQTR
jgi:hypothetical protein